METFNQSRIDNECINPGLGEKVYDYYNGALAAQDVRVFEQHLIRCSHCERIVLELDRIFFSFEEIDVDEDVPTVEEEHFREGSVRRIQNN